MGDLVEIVADEFAWNLRSRKATRSLSSCSRGRSSTICTTAKNSLPPRDAPRSRWRRACVAIPQWDTHTHTHTPHCGIRKAVLIACTILYMYQPEKYNLNIMISS